MLPFERLLVAAAILVLASCERTPVQDQRDVTSAQHTAEASAMGERHAEPLRERRADGGLTGS